MRQPDYSGQFKRDVKQAQKRGKDMSKLKILLSLLIKAEPLPTAYLDHPLKGDWRGFRDAHIEPDWLLIYKITGDTIRFVRTGRHSDLFDEQVIFTLKPISVTSTLYTLPNNNPAGHFPGFHRVLPCHF